MKHSLDEIHDIGNELITKLNYKDIGNKAISNYTLLRTAEHGWLGDKKFDEWLETKNKQGEGFKYKNIIKVKDEILQLKDLVLNDKELEKFKSKIRKIMSWQNLVNLYFAELRTVKEKIELNRFWNVYFFYNISATPKIGKSCIILINKTNAELQNVPDEVSEQYSGIYRKEAGILCFDFVALNSKKSLHIKTYLIKNNDEILLGSYVTTDVGRIIHGSIVLMSTESPQQSALISKENDEELKLLPNAIINYLSVKWRNYHKVPYPYNTLSGLEEFVRKYQEKWARRFIEREKTDVYFAIPGMAISNEDGSKYRVILKKILEDLKNSYELTHAFNFMISRDKRKDSPSAKPNLGVVSNSSIFFLIYMHGTKASFSLVQLGWAMAHCKLVVVFYEENSLSKTILRLASDTMVFHSFVDISSESVWDEIKLNIMGYLNDWG